MSLVVAELAREAVRVVGADSATFLQGQVSQDLEALGVGDSTWSFVLQPQGKVEAWVGVARLSDDEYVFDVDAGFGEELLARLERFKLRVDVEQVLVRGVTALAVRGPGAAAVTVSSDAPPLRYLRRAGWPGIEAVDVLAVGELDVDAVRDGDGTTVDVIGSDE